MNQPQSLLVVFMSVMELSWFYPWLAFLGWLFTRQDDALKPVFVFGLFFFAQGVVGLLNRWRIVDRYQRITVGGLVLLTAFAMIRVQVYPNQPLWSLRWIGSALLNMVRFDPGVKHELFLALATLAIWWRGLYMGRRSLFVDDIGFQFRLGILLLIGLLVFQALGPRQPMLGWVLSLFLCGLVSVTLARVRQGMPSRRDTRRFSLRWLFMLLMGAGGTLLLGLLVNMLLTTETAISRTLGPVFHVLEMAIFYVIFVVSYVLVWVVNFILQWFLRTFLPNEPLELETLVLSPLDVSGLTSLEGGTAPAWLEWVQRGVVALIVVGLFVLFVITVRRWQQRSSRDSDVWRESVWSSKEVGKGLLAGLRGSLRQLAGLWSGRQRQRAYSVATIRRIYASLLTLAEKRGVLRPPAETPFEHLPRLQRAFPGWEAELQTLTGAYINAHYGQVPDTEAELQALRGAWQRIWTWAESQPENEAID